jgi:hypothetical protein
MRWITCERAIWQYMYDAYILIHTELGGTTLSGFCSIRFLFQSRVVHCCAIQGQSLLNKIKRMHPPLLEENEVKIAAYKSVLNLEQKNWKMMLLFNYNFIEL